MIEHNVCFRETDPLTSRTYLVFPELIKLKKPVVEDEVMTEEGAAYTVTGATENVYASLVVLLGYTHTFTRTSHWITHCYLLSAICCLVMNLIEHFFIGWCIAGAAPSLDRRERGLVTAAA